LWDSSTLDGFSLLLQNGFRLRCMLGASIRTVLCDQFGVTEDYLDNRIGTLFLDDRPVDEVNGAVVRVGATLALSAAMPGLVGAAMRKGGPIASFRDGITHTGSEGVVTREEGFFTLKLYNMVARELGPLFLKRGIWVQADDLNEFFRTRSNMFWAGCQRIELQGVELLLEELLRGQWASEAVEVLLRVITDPHE
ncbi:MAG: hypothetical protein FJY85_06990, partial [Deltaproteobacteria bacterium]|nr:hypothetical protein [Deltaproteobacteria bacterium]